MATKIIPTKFPNSGNEIPAFFDFPELQRVVSVGYENSDICLCDWHTSESRRKGRLYSPHIQFHYVAAPISQWHILSLRGFRRGCKAVFVSGTHTHSANGLMPILSGSDFQVGDFFFRFSPDKITDCESFETPAYLVATLEVNLRTLVEEFSISLHDSVYAAEDRSIDWDQVYFSQLLNSITKDPSVKCLLLESFNSMNDVKSCVSFLVKIRNKVFHPSKGFLTKKEREELASSYVRVSKVVNEALHRPPP